MFRISAATCIAAIALACSSQAYSADVVQGAKSNAKALSGYDVTLSNGDNQVRLVKVTTNGLSVFSSFANGILIASAQMPVDADASPTMYAQFNQYLKTSLTAMQSTGVDPNVVGIKIMNDAPMISSEGNNVLATALKEARNNKNENSTHHMTVEPGINQ